MLRAVKSVCSQQRGETLTAAIAAFARGQKLVEQRWHRGGELGSRPRGAGELLQIGALTWSQLARGLAQPCWNGVLIKFHRQQGVFAGQQ